MPDSDGKKLAISVSIAPCLTVKNGAKAVEFYQAAFGAVEVHRVEDPRGGVVSNLLIDGAGFWLSGESPEDGVFSPEEKKNGLVRMILTVADPDVLVAQAIAAGATEVFPVGEGYGWRLGRVVDPFGYHWEIGHPLQEEV